MAKMVMEVFVGGGEYMYSGISSGGEFIGEELVEFGVEAFGSGGHHLE